MDNLRALIKLCAFLILTLVLVPLQCIALPFLRRSDAVYIIPRFWQKGLCVIFGLRVETIGAPVTDHQTIYIFNHISYLDIPVISSIITKSFVAKKDVASWPVFGFLSKLQQTAFISRRRHDATEGKNALSALLAEGKSLILFPEGTSSDGRTVLPFKSSLLSIVYPLPNEAPDILIQPATLELVAVKGRVINPGNQDQLRDYYAWHGDMTLGPHLWQFAKGSGAILRIYFHPPFTPDIYKDRKALTAACHQAVAHKLDSAFAKAA